MMDLQPDDIIYIVDETATEHRAEVVSVDDTFVHCRMTEWYRAPVMPYLRNRLRIKSDL